MKYICFGCQNEKKREQMSESEKNALFDACFAYDDELRAEGQTRQAQAGEFLAAQIPHYVRDVVTLGRRRFAHRPAVARPFGYGIHVRYLKPSRSQQVQEKVNEIFA